MPRRPPHRTERGARRSGGRRRRLIGPVLLAAVVLSAASCDTSMSASPPSSGTTPVASGSDPSAGSDPGSTPTTSPGTGDQPGPGGADEPVTPGVVTGGTTVAHAPGTGSPGGTTDIRTIDFADLTFPRTACAGVIDRPPTGGYPLVDGEARSPEASVDGAYVVHLAPSLSYGDIDGDGVPDAALILECDHGSRPIPVGWIYSVAGGRPVPLAQVDLDPDALRLRGVLDTELAAMRFDGPALVTDWVVYLDGDALCCPTRRASVTWTWTDGALTPGAPQMTRFTSGG